MNILAKTQSRCRSYFPHRLSFRLPNHHIVTRRTFAASRYVIVDNPYTGLNEFEVQRIRPTETFEILDNAHTEFESWKSSSLQARKALCKGFVAELQKNEKKIAEEITRQMGKPINQSKNEIKTCIARANALIELSENGLKDEILPEANGILRRIQREPIGVVLCLVPWNYPLLCAVNSVVAAVLSGNTVLLKHADRTPLCAKHFSDAFVAAGASAHLVQPLVITHATVVKLIKQDKVKYVSFTGSVEGGEIVYKKVAKRFLDVGLELGGKDPAYVCDDADINYAITNIVDGAMYNAGQSCCSVERVYVHKSVYDRFVEGAVQEARNYVLGDPLDASTTMGPIAQPRNLLILRKRVEDAVSKGAKLLTGGSSTIDSAGKGRFFSPTVLIDCTHEMDTMQEENFGPILSVCPVQNDREAIQLMNDSKYGLTASVWTKDMKRADSINAQLDCGTVFMNRCDFLDPYLPWSGRKDSGKGISLSHLAFHSLTRTKGYNYRINT